MPSPSPSPVTEEQTSILSLPNDLLFNCFARVSRSYYPTLSLVCKTFRSIVGSSELYETRTCLNRTERCLYLCINFPSNPITHWFTLCRKPNKNVADKSSGYELVKIPSPNIGLLPAAFSSIIAVGSNIYKIGGANFHNDKFRQTTCYSSSVAVLDCRSHRWRQAPEMRGDRISSSTVCLGDGKIYVAGGCEDENWSDWIEVFDPKTKTWGSLRNPRIEYQFFEVVGPGRVVKILGLDGKLYVFGHPSVSVVYNLEEDRWYGIGVDRGLKRAIDNWTRFTCSSCVVDKVLFIWEKGLFKWFDFKVKLWKKLNGLEGTLPDLRDREYCKMVDLGGKIAVLWDERVTGKKINRIWCAEISLERRDGDEIWGKVEWFDHVLSVRSSGSLLFADVVSVVV